MTLVDAVMADQGGLVSMFSNGFYVNSSDARVNTYNDNYIYYAVADSPIGGTGISPAIAG